MSRDLKLNQLNHDEETTLKGSVIPGSIYRGVNVNGIRSLTRGE
jgi:hypothetical protein